MRVLRWLMFGLLLAAVVGAVWVFQQRRLPSPIARHIGPPVVVGALSERPVLFATAEYRFVPATTEAVEGRLTVPQNRARRDGLTVDLHYLRFPAATNDSSGTTFYLEDGPGVAASRAVAGPRFAFVQRLRAAGEVVVVDQRGTFYSPPTLQCTGRIDFRLDEEATVLNRAEVIAPYIRTCARVVNAEADLSAFNTRESARDLDALREALGLDQISLVGVGYGSQLALEYARLFPERLLSIVALGLEAPHQVYKLPSQVEPALERVAAAAAERAPNLLDDLAEVLGALESAAVTVALDLPGRPEIVLGRMDFEAWLYAALGSRTGIGAIPRAVGRALQGDYREVAEAVAQSRAAVAWSLTPVAVTCSGGASAGRLERILVESEFARLRHFPNAPLVATCGAWPAAVLPADFRFPVESDAFVLAVVGTLDVHASVEALEEALEGLPNVTVVTVEGAAGGDDLMVEPAVVADLVVQFLRQERVAVERVVLGPIRFLSP